jgi:hypothetical protein
MLLPAVPVPGIEPTQAPASTCESVRVAASNRDSESERGIMMSRGPVHGDIWSDSDSDGQNTNVTKHKRQRLQQRARSEARKRRTKTATIAKPRRRTRTRTWSGEAECFTSTSSVIVTEHWWELSVDELKDLMLVGALCRRAKRSDAGQFNLVSIFQCMQI